MKNIFSLILITFCCVAFAQVAIGNGARPTNDRVSIEFGTAAPAQNLGILLPWVTNVTGLSAPVGTLVFDAATQKVKLATSSTPTAVTAPSTLQSAWFDLSNGAATPVTPYTNPVTPLGENANAKTIIGSASSPVDGILILETPNPDNAPKAMVLPRVNNYSDIINPSAGMIVYVKTNKRLAVFNGREWAFWTATQ